MVVQTRQEALQILASAPVSENDRMEWVVQQSSLAQHVPPSPSMIQEVHQIQAAMAHHQLSMPVVAYDRAFYEIRLYRLPNCDVIFSPLALCPLYVALKGKLLAPPHALDALARLEEAGYGQIRIYAAHEVPKGVVRVPDYQTVIRPEDVPLEYLVPRLPASVERKYNVSRNLHHAYRQGMLGALKGIALVGAGVTAGVAVVGAAATLPLLAVGAATGLDPVLMVAVEDSSTHINGQHPAMFIKVADWVWD